MNITSHDREILRDLAKKQLEYARLPVMDERRKAWTAHNDLKGDIPMIHVELWTFEQDVLPPLRCETEAGREMEGVMTRCITNHEWIDDDRVVHDFYPLEWKTRFRLFDLDVKVETPGEGGVGHQFIHTIKDFPNDFHALSPSVYDVDREGTLAWKNLVDETIGDILPVRMGNGSAEISLSQHVVHMMGMEAMIFAIMDYPDEFHAFMSRIADDHISYYKWLENEGLLFLNNGDDHLGQGSFGFSDDLPRKDRRDNTVRTNDLWVMMESQETVSISPEMFEEFFFPYYKRTAEHFGLISYGCCEPVHALWENCISRYPNVRKVSISPWCDEQMMGEYLRGSSTIYHRKPSPNFMGLDKFFDEEGYRSHIKKTLDAARGCKLEFGFRDVYTLCGEKDRPRKMVGILREMIEDHWQ
ncbi:MAG: hypothetical protein PQJ58_10495 [Spirochaetales bacterium]|nr:hypothetical protein [Spirochaetales bacterium]